MKVIRNKILHCLYKYSNNDELLISELNRIIAEHGSKTYPIIFHVLTHLELEKEDAESAWSDICSHRHQMSDLLGHSVNLRTAICDYFCSIHKSFQNPKVVEIHVFENTINTAKYDRLTGLYNRAFFDETLISEVSRAKRYDTELSVLFLDIDDFKVVNDTHGHLAGDYALKDVSQAIIDEVRSADTPSRYGGEEIVIILPETRKETALILAERIRELIENMSMNFDDNTIKLTVSGGLASFPIDTTDARELVKFADMALFKAKGAGKNNIQLYSANKRRYVRVDFTAEILVKEISLNGDLDSIKANAKNISLTGILFESNQPFEIGRKLQMQIPFDDFNETLMVLGTVVRIEFFDTNQYDIGISFLEMDASAKNEVSRYLLQKLGQNHA